jgi:hypothetical protein
MDHQTFAQLLGNYGEFVGAIAVVFTLAYLALQIRQTNKIQKTLTRQNYTDAAQRRIELVFKYPEIRTATMKLIEGSNLQGDEPFLMRSAARYRLRGYENDFYQYRNGLLDEGEFIAIRREIGLSFKSGVIQHEDWVANRPTMTSQFAEEVDGIITQFEESEETWAFSKGLGEAE